MILDTTVLVDLVRSQRQAQRRISSLESAGDPLWVPAPAVFELYEGAERADRPSQEFRRLEEVLRGHTLMDFGTRHAMRAGRVYGELIRRGLMIDPVDAQIGGMALEEQEPVLTRNTKDFARVENLEVVTY